MDKNYYYLSLYVNFFYKKTELILHMISFLLSLSIIFILLLSYYQYSEWNKFIDINLNRSRLLKIANQESNVKSGLSFDLLFHINNDKYLSKNGISKIQKDITNINNHLSYISSKVSLLFKGILTVLSNNKVDLKTLKVEDINNISQKISLPLKDNKLKNIVFYTIGKGDYLSKISNRYKVKISDVLKYNSDIVNPNLIQYNQIIKIPIFN